MMATTVKVCHLDYEVRLSDEIMFQGYECDGLCDKDNCVIEVANGMSDALKVETLLHEIGHAVNSVAGLTDESTEEEFVARSTPLWILVFKENPLLIQCIVEQSLRPFFGIPGGVS